MKNFFRFIKENIFWIGIVVGVIVLTIITNLPTILSIGDGSFFKGILLAVILIIGVITIFKAFGNLIDGVDKQWKGYVYLIIFFACLFGFITLIKSM